MIEIAGIIFGGLLRLAPEVLKWLNLRTEQAHEFRMQELQIERDKLLHQQEIAKLSAESQIVLDKGGLDALLAGITAQGRVTGHPVIDFINATVRPFITYWWLSMYTVVKISMVYLLISGGIGFAEAMLQAWTSFDAATLGGIINFWFLDRVIKKRDHLL